MCGLIGYFQTKKEYFKKDETLKFNKLLGNLDRRGPDYKNYFIDKNKKFYLGHTRLSILDLSESSNQPVFSNNNNLVMVFNGEIYNHEELYKNIANLNLPKNIQNSDTLTLLENISHFGLYDTLKIVNGMFAIALYDFTEKNYILQETFGEKNPCIIFLVMIKFFFINNFSNY